MPGPVTSCPKCGAKYRVNEAMVGKNVRCRTCSTTFRATVSTSAGDSGIHEGVALQASESGVHVGTPVTQPAATQPAIATSAPSLAVKAAVSQTPQEAPYGRKTQRPPAVKEVHILWLSAGLSCDGDTVSITAATQPSIEDIVLGAIPGLPKVHLHNPVLAYETGEAFLKVFREAAEGKLAAPYVLVVEGSIPNEKIKREGYWAAMGTDPATGQPITTCEWIDRLAPNATAVVAIGTCATYGGMHAMSGNPTGAMGLPDYLGWEWKSPAGIPIVCVPGCPVQPDNFMETVLYLLYQVAGLAPMIPLDSALRPTWLFGATVHEGCDRAGYYEQADFATEYGSPKCIVKLGCWGPVVQCNVGKRGWMAGIGGCPNVGGICIGCTMPGFPDKFMPFMEEPPGAKLSSTAVGIYGRTVRALRAFTQSTMNREPVWRQPSEELTTGYKTDRY